MKNIKYIALLLITIMGYLGFDVIAGVGLVLWCGCRLNDIRKENIERW